MGKHPRDTSGRSPTPPDAQDDEFFPLARPGDEIDEDARRQREARLARDRAALEDPRAHRVHEMKYSDQQPAKGRFRRKGRDTQLTQHDAHPDDLAHPDHLDADGIPLPRSFADKMFGISFWGWIRLGALCLVAGAIFEAGGVNPFAPAFTWSSVPGALGQGVINVFTWSVGTGWRPLLFGALAIVPIWLCWRLITVPFRH